MTEDPRRHSGANPPLDFDGVSSLSPGFGDALRGAASAASDSELWGLGSARRSRDGAAHDRSNKVFHSLSAQFVRPLETGYIPFDLAPAALRAPSAPLSPGAPTIRTGEQIALPAKGGAVSMWFGRAMAFGLHAAVIGLLTYDPVSSEYGGSHIQSTAISVNVTTTQVLDSLDDKADDGAAMQIPLAQNTPEPEPEPEKTPEPPKPDENIVLASPNADAAPLAPEPVKPPEEKKEEEVKKVEQKAPKPTPQNVATSSGVTQTTGSNGRVSASYGDMWTYNASVRAKIAKHKPRDVESHGVTIISFEISGTGALTSCHIVDSSGDSTLDSAALRAIRNSSPFAPPPGGRSRTFTIPFKFH